MSWISDEDIQSLVKWRKEHAKKIEEAKYRAKMADSMKKVVLALEMKKSDEKTAAAQERDALTSKGYLDAINEDAEAAANWEMVSSLDDVAKMKFDAWRTMTSMQKALMK